MFPGLLREFEIFIRSQMRIHITDLEGVLSVSLLIRNHVILKMARQGARVLLNTDLYLEVSVLISLLYNSIQRIRRKLLHVLDRKVVVEQLIILAVTHLRDPH